MESEKRPKPNPILEQQLQKSKDKEMRLESLLQILLISHLHACSMKLARYVTYIRPPKQTDQQVTGHWHLSSSQSLNSCLFWHGASAF